MLDRVIHTPEGVRDIYGKECKQKRKLLEQFHQVMHLYHYDEITTPTIEFFDIFNQDKGTAQSTEMFKLFDRENNTLVLRPDLTPAIARCVSKYFANETQHIRLCYEGQAFLNLPRLHGKLNEFTQVGAELIGDDTSAADGEMAALMVDCLKSVGLKEFQVSIGHVEYFLGLVEEAGLSSATAQKLQEAIQNKNTFAIETICKESQVKKELADAFIHLTNHVGGLDVLTEAKQIVHNERSLKAIDRLEKIYQIMCYYDAADDVSFDLGMLSNYRYYSGVILRGYTYGSGSPIATGGRYNGLMKQFGVDAPSVGFAFIVDEILLAMNHQKIDFQIEEQASMVLFEQECQETAVKLAKAMRANDQVVQLTRKSSRVSLLEYQQYCESHEIDQIIYLSHDQAEAELIDVPSKETKKAAVAALMGGAL